MMRICSTLILAWALPVCLSAGCSKDVLFEEVTQTTVETSGGRALSADGDLELEVSQGTLPGNTRITIRTLRNGNHASLVKPVYQLVAEPSVASFSPEIAIEIRNVADDGRDLVLVNTDGAQPVPVPGSTYDRAAKIVRGSLAHFSSYSVAEGPSTESCPAEEDAIGGSCTVEGAVCDYGQECCCGNCFPAVTCSCHDGTFACHATDACFISGCPDAGPSNDAGQSGCPATDDEAIGGSCTIDGLSCNYGQECCCGECFPSVSCTCSAGSFGCHATDACFRPDCPDAG